MDDRDRAEQLAQISSDLLATERFECRLIEAAKAVDTVVDFREDATPAAVLNVELIATPQRR